MKRIWMFVLAGFFMSGCLIGGSRTSGSGTSGNGTSDPLPASSPAPLPTDLATQLHLRLVSEQDMNSAHFESTGNDELKLSRDGAPLAVNGSEAVAVDGNLGDQPITEASYELTVGDHSTQGLMARDPLSKTFFVTFNVLFDGKMEEVDSKVDYSLRINLFGNFASGTSLVTHFHASGPIPAMGEEQPIVPSGDLAKIVEDIRNNGVVLKETKFHNPTSRDLTLAVTNAYSGLILTTTLLDVVDSPPPGISQDELAYYKSTQGLLEFVEVQIRGPQSYNLTVASGQSAEIALAGNQTLWVSWVAKPGTNVNKCPFMDTGSETRQACVSLLGGRGCPYKVTTVVNTRWLFAGLAVNGNFSTQVSATDSAHPAPAEPIPAQGGAFPWQVGAPPSSLSAPCATGIY